MCDCHWQSIDFDSLRDAPRSITSLRFKLQFINEINLVVGADAHIGPQEKCYEFAGAKRKYANNTAGPMWASAPTDKFA